MRYGFTLELIEGCNYFMNAKMLAWSYVNQCGARFFVKSCCSFFYFLEKMIIIDLHKSIQ